jgi:hypothetical protein
MPGGGRLDERGHVLTLSSYDWLTVISVSLGVLALGSHD